MDKDKFKEYYNETIKEMKAMTIEEIEERISNLEETAAECKARIIALKSKLK